MAEFVCDRVVNYESVCRRAGLTDVAHLGKHRSVYSGIDVGIFRVSDSVADAGSVFDSAQLLLLLQGTGSAAALAPENVVDFQ